MPSKSSKQQAFFQAVRDVQMGRKSPHEVSPSVNKVAHTISAKDAEDFAKNVSELKHKKAMLSILKDIREPMYLNEEGEDQGGIDPVANTFHKKADWANYIKPYVGQPLSQKDFQAIDTFKQQGGKAATTVARTEIWYNTTDSFSVSHTTVIRKMKDSGQFSFIAFQKQERPEPDDKEKEQGMDATGPEDISGGLGGPDMDQPPAPEGGAVPGSPTPPAETPQQQQEKDNVDIIVTKSVLFKDDIKGAAILVEFLKKLDL